MHINGAILVFLFILATALIFRRILGKNLEKHLVPSPKFGFLTTVDVVVEALYGMVEGTLGPETKKYFPFIGSIFLFVFFSNLMGLLPYSAAATASVNTTFALGLAAFVYYNVMGLKEHGLKNYLAHFLMGLGPFGIFIAVIEIVSHCVRPLSLGVRLFVNMFVDHAVVSSFSSLVAWIVPVPLILFGVVVCTIQAFVFATLTAVYVQMATEHEH